MIFDLLTIFNSFLRGIKCLVLFFSIGKTTTMMIIRNPVKIPHQSLHSLHRRKVKTLSIIVDSSKNETFAKYLLCESINCFFL